MFLMQFHLQGLKHRMNNHFWYLNALLLSKLLKCHLYKLNHFQTFSPW